MLCALCSITLKMGITKGRGQNIVRGPKSKILPCQFVKRVQKPKAVIFCPGLSVLQLDSPKGSAQCFVVSTCTEPKSIQNFPNNIVLTSLCYCKYYTMYRCLSMPVMPVKAAHFVRGACSQFPLQVHHVH